MYGLFEFNWRTDQAAAQADARAYNRKAHDPKYPFAVARAEQVGCGWTVAVYENGHRDAFIVAYV